MSVGGSEYAVERDEIIARENVYQLIELDSENFKGVPLEEIQARLKGSEKIRIQILGG